MIVTSNYCQIWRSWYEMTAKQFSLLSLWFSYLQTLKLDLWMGVTFQTIAYWFIFIVFFSVKVVTFLRTLTAVKCTIARYVTLLMFSCEVATIRTFYYLSNFVANCSIAASLSSSGKMYCMRLSQWPLVRQDDEQEFSYLLVIIVSWRTTESTHLIPGNYY